MKRDWWTPQELRNAAKLLTDAANNLHTTFPHSEASPNKNTLSAVKAMISAAEDCIRAAQPQS